MVTALTELGEDAIIHILRFVGALHDLKQMGFTSTQFRSLVFDSPIVDQIFQMIHPETDSYQRSRIGGRQYWKNMYQIRQSLEEVKSCNDRASPLQTTSILSAQEELESLCYDNPNYRLSRPSVGYFGFQPLEGSPVAVWGDFHGLAIVPSLDALTGSSRIENSEQQDTASRSSSASVSASTAIPISSSRNTGTTKICSDAFQIMAIVYQRSKLFLGNASGLVQSVLVRKDEISGSYDFPVLSTSTHHDNEVTSLACAGNHLASACVNGYVILHLDALEHGRVDEACIRIVDSQRLLFSMASITTSHGKTILCMGGEERVLEALFWDANHFQNPEHRIDKVSSEGQYTGDRQLFRNRRLGHLTNLKFLGWRHPRLVAGTSIGDVAVHDVTLAPGNEDYTKSLKWRYDLNGCCRGGCVESVQLVGSLLITAGGQDGTVRTWDFETGAAIATLRIHPGRLFEGVTLKCAVVSTYVSHERQSILCMCRDGHIREWSFQSNPPLLAAAQHSGSTRSRKRSEDTTVATIQASRRSTRSRSELTSHASNADFQFY